jgi:hypothetical protein
MSTQNYTPGFSIEKMKEDPDFTQLFKQKATEIKATKANLVEAAKSYQDKYSDEIDRGTRKRQLMLQEGAAKGLNEEQVFQNNSLFIPTKQTPILNYLFFLLRETKVEDIDIRVLRNSVDGDKDFRLLKEEYEKKYGAELHEEHENPLPNMMKFAYGTIDDQTMNTLKKLKTLSESENREEGFAAYRKCLDLCKKYNIEFSQIPVNR